MWDFLRRVSTESTVNIVYSGLSLSLHTTHTHTETKAGNSEIGSFASGTIPITIHIRFCPMEVRQRPWNDFEDPEKVCAVTGSWNHNPNEKGEVYTLHPKGSLRETSPVCS